MLYQYYTDLQNGSVMQRHYVHKQKFQEEQLHLNTTSWDECAEEELHNADFIQI